MDPAKVSAVTEWPSPSSCMQLQRFLGFTKFYWRFIKNFSSIVALLDVLTSSKVRFKWSAVAQECFLRLKDLF